MKPKLFQGLGPLFVGLALSFVQPAQAASLPTTPPGGKLFRMRLPFEPATLDWTLGDIPIPVIQNVMRGLYRVDAKGQVVPDLVEEGSSTEKGRVWKFKLKPGVLWSDGKPLNSQHVIEGFRRLLSPATASSYAYFLYDIEGALAYTQGKAGKIGARALSDLELEVRLERPLPHFPAILTHWVTFPVRQDLIAQHPGYWSRPDLIATLGAYRIKEWQKTNRIVLSPNPHAKLENGKKPWFERIEAWVIPDDNTAVNLYETGHLEFMTEPGEVALRHPDLSHKPSPILYFVGLGPGHPLSRSKAGALALSAALRRADIPKILNAPHRPTLEPLPPEIWNRVGYSPKSSDLLDADPELAKSLLKEAGFANPKEVPPIQLYYFQRPAMAQIAQWIQSQWKKNLGIEVKLEGIDPKLYWAQLGKSPAAFFLNSKGASYPDPDTFFRLFIQKSTQNVGRWTDTEFDDWVEKAAHSSSDEERRALYQQASRRLVQEKPAMIPLYFRSTQYLIKPFVKGLVINPLSSIDFSGAEYKMER